MFFLRDTQTPVERSNDESVEKHFGYQCRRRRDGGENGNSQRDKHGAFAARTS